MRCNPDDLAVVIYSSAGNQGKVIRVTRLCGCGDPLGPTWRYEGAELHNVEGLVTLCIADQRLLPIRDQPGTDEMIRIAGLPSQIKETV